MTPPSYVPETIWKRGNIGGGILTSKESWKNNLWVESLLNEYKETNKDSERRNWEERDETRKMGEVEKIEKWEWTTK